LGSGRFLAGIEWRKRAPSAGKTRDWIGRMIIGKTGIVQE